MSHCHPTYGGTLGLSGSSLRSTEYNANVWRWKKVGFRLQSFLAGL